MKTISRIFIATLLMVDKCGLNVKDIVLEKIKQNSEKYPVEKAKGTAKKYNEL